MGNTAWLLACYMRRIYEKELTTTSGGNLSIREENGDIWITPSGVDKGNLTEQDMVCVKPDGTWEGAHKPSLELPFHRMLYAARPDLRAVLHAHPAALTAFSMVRQCPDLRLMPRMQELCPRVELAAYAVPGSARLGENIAACFREGSNAVILENHGVCVGGGNLDEAYRTFESLNHLARIQLLAGRIGIPRPAASRYREPVIQFRSPQGEELEAAKGMLQTVWRACRHGLFTSALGLCSLRLPNGKLLTLPMDRDLEQLRPEDLQVISSRHHVHGAIYEKDPDVGAIIQACPPHAMAFAVTDAKFDTYAIPESYVLLRQVPRIPCGEQERVNDVLDSRHPAAMVENRCFVVAGRDLLQAFDRLEVVETTAHALLDAVSLGSIVRITPEEEVDLKKTYGLED